MDEVYTCVCKCQSWEIHDGFIRCCSCSKECDFKRFFALSGMKGQALQSVTEFNERVKQVKKDIADDSKTEGGG